MNNLLDLQLLQHAVQDAIEKLYTWRENAQQNLILALIAIRVGILHNSVETSLKKKLNALDITESDEDVFLETVSSTIESPFKVKATVSLNGKRVVFKINKGAYAIVIPEGLVPHGTQVIPTSRRFYGPGHLEVVAVGTVSAELQLVSGNKAAKVIYVLKEQKEALLRRPAIQGLDMIQRSTLSQNQKKQDRR